MFRPTLSLALLAGVSIYGVACAGSPPFESDYMKVKGDTDGGSASGQGGPNGSPTSAGGDDGGASSSGDDGGAGTTNNGGDDGGGSGNNGDDGGGSAGTINGCTAADFAANDFSAPNATRTIANGPSTQVIVGFKPDTHPVTPSQYTPNCMTISAAESVTWVGAFTDFPLGPSGGTTPTPIANVTTGTTTSVAFPTPGTYGFNNPNAPTVMFGAILVTQ